MTREDMIKISKTLSIEQLLDCYGIHAAVLAGRDHSEEYKARAKMANEVITAELISRYNK